jgi:hypothetical protein
MFEKTRGVYQKYQRWTPIAFFIAGFIFDAFMLRRVDELLTIVQQAVYLFISAILIRYELLESQRELAVPGWFKKIWHYREDALHFLMGTLMNAYTIFYFKSASAITSFVFIVLLAFLLVMNEFGRFGKSQTQVHVAILSLCLISYFVTLVPIVLGFMGIIPFLIANGVALLVFWLFTVWVRPLFHENPHDLRKQVQLPFAGILSLFAILYFAHAIPPVPLSVRYMGVYHNVVKEGGNYRLTYSPDQFFWHHGDQTFRARPGDSIFCFARIFSPTRFKDQLQVRWLYDDPKRGWQTSDIIALPIVGGREEGFRGFTKKTNYQPGDWRVQIETKDSREIGRLNFTVESDSGDSERAFATSED